MKDITTHSKISIIKEITKIDAGFAWDIVGEYRQLHPNLISAFDGFDHPYRKYVHNERTYLGDTGGPSRADIYQNNCSWKLLMLTKANKSELQTLLNDLNRQLAFNKLSFFDLCKLLG